MQKLNTTLFDLTTIYTNINYGDTWFMLETLLEVKGELDECKDFLTAMDFLSSNELETYEYLSLQLSYINQNVKILENAMLCHETKIFEKRTIMGVLTNICLN